MGISVVFLEGRACEAQQRMVHDVVGKENAMRFWGSSLDGRKQYYLLVLSTNPTPLRRPSQASYARDTLLI